MTLRIAVRVTLPKLGARLHGHARQRAAIVISLAVAASMQLSPSFVGEVHTYGFAPPRATGVLVGPCHALTARHLLGKADVRGRLVMFRSGDAASGAVVILTGPAPAAEDVHDFSGDWALLRLNKCLGLELGYLPISNSLSSTAVVAMAWQKASGTIDVTSCRIASYVTGTLRTNCPAKPGYSGGPLIGTDSMTGKAVVVGLTSARSRDARSPENYAVPLFWISKSQREEVERELRILR